MLCGDQVFFYSTGESVILLNR